MKNTLKNTFITTFGNEPAYLFSAPGRTEVSGNHTDHQHGRVLAASINLSTDAAVAVNHNHTISVLSEGYPMCVIDLNDLAVKEAEKGTTAALIRGVAARIQELGHPVTGFNATMESTVLAGSGLSSSAAFEVLIGTILNELGDKKLTAVEIAQISQYAENVYFGKPCGLMDQMACSVGNIITIDFNDPAKPIIEKLDFDFASAHHALCIIDTGADHANLTDEYAAIPAEMKIVAHYFGKEFLRDVKEEDFYSHLKEVRELTGDRAALRAMHIFEENKRVEKIVAALKKNDFETFLKLVNESGLSSWLYLQNVVVCGTKEHQDVAFALALASHLLNGRGACRVHGGGFAGTIQAFVPEDMLETFKVEMEKVIGEGKCHILSITPLGGHLVEKL